MIQVSWSAELKFPTFTPLMGSTYYLTAISRAAISMFITTQIFSSWLIYAEFIILHMHLPSTWWKHIHDDNIIWYLRHTRNLSFRLQMVQTSTQISVLNQAKMVHHFVTLLQALFMSHFSVCVNTKLHACHIHLFMANCWSHISLNSSKWGETWYTNFPIHIHQWALSFERWYSSLWHTIPHARIILWFKISRYGICIWKVSQPLFGVAKPSLISLSTMYGIMMEPRGKIVASDRAICRV